MNLDSIHRLIEETHIFQMREPSVKPPCDMLAPASSPKDTCPSCLPHQGLQSRAAHNFCAHSCNTSEWNICEELRLRELEEVKARAAQMEKTMRWWSDCTANWREKWSKVRAERNSAREEGRQLRIKLEMTMKELSALKKKQSLPHQKEVLETTQDLKHPTFMEVPSAQRDPFHLGSQTWESIRECPVKREFPTKENPDNKEEGLNIDQLKLNEEMKLNLNCPDSLKNVSENGTLKSALRPQAINLPLKNKVPEISALQVHLDEFQKVLWKEREKRSSLEKEIERLESALSVWKWKYEELKDSEPKNLKEFNIIPGQHENEMKEISGDIKEESKSQTGKDRVIYELRAELERLQAENILERDKREILETEKQGLERENRRLKAQVEEMEELLERRNVLSANSPGPDFKTSQIELQEKNQGPWRDDGAPRPILKTAGGPLEEMCSAKVHVLWK
ncbi:coiled-coil domain-containing protein 102B isoform X1 [Prionailurus viverrinus]|uniref:coiled-coil domain-containing protein 102B isoform X1 n=1 Tax=Prionailurus viverrinus TaxID=61388 RepID=UPI001FF42769|nr:coiled-coil domain-containing protein 102B isoform X1 [Prionailurus viverrinus]XP_047684834.1 coiled-coil domain-containing protein 102B isoform X1 [Prionailurus viverrinus]XP_047684836.1 coiled-coil domain-containing protein 102B isoform X1 [Prionailurus viverrinus]XP_047684837.1 coiled-coil domain-containing protein 102B isoform X1 [Prionailurus viverrinus]XP_047684838.1 coiled-coil domain-containing protein 102B isoform X1 [Prionailurus viverrinus]XP_047684839.1 coiled-coil domain-contai